MSKSLRVPFKLCGSFVASASCSQVKVNFAVCLSSIGCGCCSLVMQLQHELQCQCNLACVQRLDRHALVFELRSCAAARSSSRSTKFCFRMPTISIADSSPAVATCPAYDFPGGSCLDCTVMTHAHSCSNSRTPHCQHSSPHHLNPRSSPIHHDPHDFTVQQLGFRCAADTPV